MGAAPVETGNASQMAANQPSVGLEPMTASSPWNDDGVIRW